MTADELAAYYAGLLIAQYREKDNAFDTTKAIAKLIVMDKLPDAVQNAFNLETATGVQLDVVAKYAGVSRYGNDFSGPVTLTDEQLLQLIKIAIVTNTSKSSLAAIVNLLTTYFDGIIYVFDYANMRIGYFFDSDALSTTLAQFFIEQGSLPKPMGVQLGLTIYLPSIDNFFGFRDDLIPGYAWSAVTTYDTGDVVEDGTTNNLYVSIIDGNLNNAVSNAAAWTLLPFPVGGFCVDTNGLSGSILTDGDFI